MGEVGREVRPAESASYLARCGLLSITAAPWWLRVVSSSVVSSTWADWVTEARRFGSSMRGGVGRSVDGAVLGLRPLVPAADGAGLRPGPVHVVSRPKLRLAN